MNRVTGCLCKHMGNSPKVLPDFEAHIESVRELAAKTPPGVVQVHLVMHGSADRCI
jgi:hypothetical protein